MGFRQLGWSEQLLTETQDLCQRSEKEMLMLSRWVRTWYSRLLQPFLLLLAGFGVTPTMLTISSLLLILVSGFVLSQNHLIIGGIFLLLGGLLDGIDGELARVTNRTTKFGAFLD